MSPEESAAIVSAVTLYTMTDQTRIMGLIRETERVIRSQIPGDIVECGVWRGGSMMAVALVLLRLGVTDRDLWLFDTYTGMTAPESVDIDCYGRPALRPETGSYDSAGCTVPLHEVQRAMSITNYPAERLHYVPGMVEDTLPDQAPATIVLLHLDTDWYRSTRHELETLFPRVSPSGCIMIDDYGHWQGARRATDEYLEQNAPGLTPEQCGYSAVILRKP